MNTTLQSQLDEALEEVKRLRKLSKCRREPDLKSLGGIIQKRREELGLSLREASRKVGISPSLLSRIERDFTASNPTFQNILPLAEMLATSLSQIFSQWERVNMPPSPEAMRIEAEQKAFSEEKERRMAIARGTKTTS